jgi:carbon storage regulator
MLVLARKSNELIHIGDSITVKVISIRNGQVKLGIEAPREMRVTRDGRREGRGGAGPDGMAPEGTSPRDPAHAANRADHRDV